MDFKNTPIAPIIEILIAMVRTRKMKLLCRQVYQPICQWKIIFLKRWSILSKDFLKSKLKNVNIWLIWSILNRIWSNFDSKYLVAGIIFAINRSIDWLFIFKSDISCVNSDADDFFFRVIIFASSAVFHHLLPSDYFL